MWVIENSTKLTRLELAAHFGIGIEGIKSLVSRIRKTTWVQDQGLEIGRYQPKKVKSKLFVEKAVRHKILTPEQRVPARRGKVSTQHMEKPRVGGGFAPLGPGEQIFKTRKVVDGPIKVKFKKGNTTISANDQDHVDRIIKVFSESLGEYVVCWPDNYD